MSNGLSTLYGYRKLVPFERFPLLFKAPLGHPEVKVLGRILGLEFDDALDRSGIVFGGSRYGHRLILDAHVAPLVLERGPLPLVEVVAAKAQILGPVLGLRPIGIGAFKGGNGHPLGQVHHGISGRRLVALPSPVPVTSSVDKVSLPDHGQAHVVGVKGQVHALMVTHTDGPRTGPVYKITINGSFAFRRLDEHSYGSPAAGGLSRESLLLDAGARPGDGKLLSSAFLEKPHLDLVFALFQLYRTRGTLHSVNAIVIHDELAIDQQEGSVIGRGSEGVFAFLGAIDFTGKGETEVIVAISWRKIKEPIGQNSRFLGLEFRKIRHLVPTAMIEFIVQVGDGVGQLAHPHDAIHELKVSGESANVRVVTLLLGGFEIDRGFHLGLDHSGTCENARVPLRFPVHLHSFVTEFQNRIDYLLSLVSPLLLARRTQDQVMGKRIRILEDQFDLGVRLYAETAYVVLHLSFHRTDDDLPIDFFKALGGLVGVNLNPRKGKHKQSAK